MDDTDDDERTRKVAAAQMPFAVVGATDEMVVDGTLLRGRKTRYGFLDVDNPEHCEFPLLRDMLVRTSLLDLVETTDRVHYEVYREQHCTAIP